MSEIQYHRQEDHKFRWKLGHILGKRFLNRYGKESLLPVLAGSQAHEELQKQRKFYLGHLRSRSFSVLVAGD